MIDSPKQHQARSGFCTFMVCNVSLPSPLSSLPVPQNTTQQTADKSKSVSKIYTFDEIL